MLLQKGLFLRKEVAELEKEGFQRSADNLEQLIIQIVQDATEVTGTLRFDHIIP